MAGFTTYTGKIAVLNEDDIDTDRIIPARFLTMVTRSGYGDLVFKDVRGPDFPLDKPDAQGASILVVGKNFGCGSSREHAVWAIQQAGFKAVIAKKTDIAPGFSDIFRGNAGNCGLALIELEAEDQAMLAGLGSGREITIDLLRDRVTSPAGEFTFEIGPASKHQLILGQDLIDMTLASEKGIEKYEGTSGPFVPKPIIT